MIFPVWQSLGSSTHTIAQTIGEQIQEPTTHTGTLDPMAEGVVVILTGDDRFAKGQLSDWDKTYEFSILWGIETDSLDRLGLITCVDVSQVQIHNLQTHLDEFPQSYAQVMPKYSSQRFEGKSGFDWARAAREIPRKMRRVQVSKIEMIQIESLSWDNIQRQHKDSIGKVVGDFRQSEVVDSWKEQTIPMQTEFVISHHKVTVSTGTYIRQLVKDIAREVGMKATTWSITRTKNGPYEKQDCEIVLENILPTQLAV